MPHWVRSKPFLPVGLFVGVVWLVFMTVMGKFDLFLSNWFMSVTMLFGSFIAGSTSIGGGAVAFPVMTLAFNIDPVVARDFSLMIQSVGMMAATVSIFLMRIPVERKALLWGGLGGLPGLLLGFEILTPLLNPAVMKTLFGSFVFSFGLTLWWINRRSRRFAATEIRRFAPPQKLLLFSSGFLGGVISGALGSGVDIVVFSVLVLRFGICEKIATPTSVVLMGTNALAGMLWGGATGALSPAAWDYWWVCAPVVAFGAPFGAWCISHWPRIHVVRFLCVLIVMQYIAVLLIIPQSIILLSFNICVIILTLLLFRWLWHGYKTHRIGLGG